MSEQSPTVEDLAVRDLERHAEQVAAKFEKLAADIRQAVKGGVISAKESSPTDGMHEWRSYSGVAATIVKEVHVALFNLPFDQLIRDGGAADAARERAS